MNKSIEIELKFNVTDEQVEQIKKHSNTSFLEETYQKTVMFDNSSQLMQYTDGRIRLRQEGEIISLSYKRPLPSVGNEKKEVELETTVGDFEAMTHVLRMMGFSPTTSYEKYTSYSESYKNVKIEIQRYPFATFLEIEGEKEDIEEVAKEFDLSIVDALKKPVDTLFCEWRLEKKLPLKKHMTFEDYDK